MLPSTFDHMCAAACRRLKPHQPVRLLRPGPPETWALRCLGCGQVRGHRVVHLHVGLGRAACGAQGVGLAERVTGVSCQGCLASAARPLAMALPESREPCNGLCGRETLHAWSAWLSARGEEEVLPRCSACGQRGPARRLKHLAYSVESTWCGLPHQRHVRRVVADPRAIDCPECFTALCDEGVVLTPTPDWRPTELVAEDFYAV